MARLETTRVANASGVLFAALDCFRHSLGSIIKKRGWRLQAFVVQNRENFGVGFLATRQKLFINKDGAIFLSVRLSRHFEGKKSSINHK